jgi:hypothetical protein
MFAYSIRVEFYSIHANPLIDNIVFSAHWHMIKYWQSKPYGYGVGLLMTLF